MGAIIVKKLFCCVLIAFASALTFTGCGPKLDDITELEIMAFYENYIVADDFKYLIIKTPEDIFRDGVPQYVLDRWGMEYSSLTEFDAIADYVAAEEMAQLESLNTGEWTYYNIFRLDEMQLLMDGMWGAGKTDVTQWYQNDRMHYISQSGYMVAFVIATGWYDIRWIELDGIELDGTKATLFMKALVCFEDGKKQLRDYSKMSYVYNRGDYELAYPVIAENFDPYVYWDGTVDDVLGSIGIARDDVGTIKLEFEMTKEGVRLVNCGPEIDNTKPKQKTEGNG